MLRIQTFTFNAFQENTYLISNEQRQCWIVDPGMYDTAETNRLFQHIDATNLTPQAIINTHTHLDHIFGVQACIDRFAIPFLIHEKELPILHSASASAAMFGIRFPDVPVPTNFISERQSLELGNELLEIRLTPGHSPGSVSFYYPAGKWVIAGDALFNGSIGRTDLPGGDFNTLIQSIREQLFTLPDDTDVHSGHGLATTIGREKQFNPFLQ